jgi:flagellin
MAFTASVSGTSAAELELTDGTNTYTIAAGTGDEDFAAGTYNITDASSNVVGTITLDAAAATAIANDNAVDFATFTAADQSVTLQTGSNEGDTLSVQIDDMSATGLGVTGSGIATQEAASSAITTVNDAINSVSTQRAHLGALQNRLEHKINNLNTSSENLSSAESRIRDVDMAQEMTEYTQTSILVQAATSMLAQANSAPQNVLSLLQ